MTSIVCLVICTLLWHFKQSLILCHHVTKACGRQGIEREYFIYKPNKLNIKNKKFTFFKFARAGEQTRGVYHKTYYGRNLRFP
jgi:hypothetical protein